MYAIIIDGGRQYRVEEGQELNVDYRGLPAGEQVVFEKVAACCGDSGTTLGRPTVEGASVTAEVVGTYQGPKIVVQKLRRRKNSRRRTGHRQMYTKVRIGAIVAGS